MSITLYWMQCGGCSGDTMSFLNAESPDIIEFIQMNNIEVLWQPSMSNISHLEHCNLIERMIEGKQSIDILCVEGAVLRGPSGTGMYHTYAGKPHKDILHKLAYAAKYVIAVGTCASFGGISAMIKNEAYGLQFLKKRKGGFLGSNFKSKSGLPVINLPGCPCHPSIITGAVSLIVEGSDLDLNKYNIPLQWYGMTVHQGCTRNEYHEYRVEDNEFSQRGCMFFHMGCQGPIAYGSCNKILWNYHSSKTRMGIPCFGCTMPDFPKPGPFFETPNIEGTPFELPDGVDRAHYMAYKSMAAAAAPDRLKKRKTRV